MDRSDLINRIIASEDDDEMFEIIREAAADAQPLSPSVLTIIDSATQLLSAAIISSGLDIKGLFEANDKVVCHAVTAAEDIVRHTRMHEERAAREIATSLSKDQTESYSVMQHHDIWCPKCGTSFDYGSRLKDYPEVTAGMLTTMEGEEGEIGLLTEGDMVLCMCCGYPHWVESDETGDGFVLRSLTADEYLDAKAEEDGLLERMMIVRQAALTGETPDGHEVSRRGSRDEPTRH